MAKFDLWLWYFESTHEVDYVLLKISISILLLIPNSKFSEQREDNSQFVSEGTLPEQMLHCFGEVHTING